MSTSTSTINTFDIKAPGERVLLVFDFSANFAAVIGTPSVTIAQLSGPVDPAPSSMLDGAPQISGAQVLQWCVGGLHGARYMIGCEAADAGGWRLVEAAVLPVRSVMP